MKDPVVTSTFEVEEAVAEWLAFWHGIQEDDLQHFELTWLSQNHHSFEWHKKHSCQCLKVIQHQQATVSFSSSESPYEYLL